MALPPELLQAISAEEGGKVALVIGAGCSFEAPTDLPLSRALSEETHARLVADHVLDAGECATPSDLSCVADVVFAKTGAQGEIVLRFPGARFRNAAPNDGYLLAAALLREQAIRDLLTLNFDLAARHALGAMNAGADVGVLTGPQDMGMSGVVNLVHLHRDAHADPDEWILRTEQIEVAWRDGWEELVATRVMTTPVVVFAGLGTAAAVLVETTRRIREALADHITIHVDPGAFGDSEFTATLEIPEARYVQAGWSGFMHELAARVVVEQLARLRRAVADFEAQHHLPAEDVELLIGVLEQLDLLRLGEARARWLLREDAYLPARASDPRLLADLVQAASLLARELDVVFLWEHDGRLQMRRGNTVVGVVVPVSGGGALDWTRLEAAALGLRSIRTHLSGDPLIVLAAGVTGNRQEIAPPEDLVDDEDPHDVGPTQLRPIFIGANKLRHAPQAALEALR